MKRGTPRHPKMFALAEELKITLPHAVGILEMLWHFAAESCPCGDIGSVPDKEIAKAIGWTKRASILIEALCSEKCRWIDRSLDYRLVIHDWPDHAENEVRRKLESMGKKFLPIYFPKTLKPFVCLNDGFDENKEDFPSSRKAKASGSGSGCSDLNPLKNEELTSRARVSFSDFMFSWSRHRGFRKPPKPQRDTAERKWDKIEMAEEELGAALDGYHASDWGKKNNYPILGFLKDPESWIPRDFVAQEEAVAPSVAVTPTTPEPIAPTAPYEDSGDMWNRIIPEELCFKDRYYPVKAVAECEADSQYMQRRGEAMQNGAKIRVSRPGSGWINFPWFIKPGKDGQPPGWYRLLTDLRWMTEAPDQHKVKPQGVDGFQNAIKELTNGKQQREHDMGDR